MCVCVCVCVLIILCLAVECGSRLDQRREGEGCTGQTPSPPQSIAEKNMLAGKHRLTCEHRWVDRLADLAMVHYDPTLTDDHYGASMAHHPFKDVEVYSLKRRKWRREGMEKEEGMEKDLLSALL